MSWCGMVRCGVWCVGGGAERACFILFCTSQDPGNGNASIHIAAQNGNLQMVKLAIDAGANVNQQNNGGQTGLHMAFSYDMDEVIGMLKAAGGDETIL